MLWNVDSSDNCIRISNKGVYLFQNGNKILNHDSSHVVHQLEMQGNSFLCFCMPRITFLGELTFWRDSLTLCCKCLPCTGYPPSPWLPQPARSHGEGDHVAASTTGEVGHLTDRIPCHETCCLSVRTILCPFQVHILCNRETGQGSGENSLAGFCLVREIYCG